MLCTLDESATLVPEHVVEEAFAPTTRVISTPATWGRTCRPLLRVDMPQATATKGLSSWSMTTVLPKDNALINWLSSNASARVPRQPGKVLHTCQKLIGHSVQSHRQRGPTRQGLEIGKKRISPSATSRWSCNRSRRIYIYPSTEAVG